MTDRHDADETRLGFVGAGQMAEAIARGVLEAGVFPASALLASDVSADRRRVFESLGAATTDDNAAVANCCRTVLVAVKPQNLHDVLPAIGAALTTEHLLITICAGCATTQFEAATDAAVRVVRAMPNLPMRVGLGVTAMCGGRNATRADVELAAKIFRGASKVVEVEERLMDAVTALSGSGPAYFFYLVELMTEAGCHEGLTEEVARTLAIQTARGAAEMMEREDASPQELRQRVTSKGGTTEAAFRRMTEGKVGEGIVAAIEAAAARARELGRKE